MKVRYPGIRRNSRTPTREHGQVKAFFSSLEAFLEFIASEFVLHL